MAIDYFTRTERYYRHSGRFDIVRTPVAVGLSFLFAVVLGTLYAYIVLYIPIAGITTVPITLASTIALGQIVGRLLKWARVRNVWLTNAIGLITGSLLLVTSWEIWVFGYLQRANQPVTLLQVLANPIGVWHVILTISEHGVWIIHNVTYTGASLWLIWIGEAGCLFGIPFWHARKAIIDLPFCEHCNKWCVRREIVSLNPVPHEQIHSIVETKNFAAIAAIGVAPDGAMHCLAFTFEGCADCGINQALCVDDIAHSYDPGGALKTKIRPIVKRLRLTPEEAVAIATQVAILNAPPTTAPETTPPSAAEADPPPMPPTPA